MNKNGFTLVEILAVIIITLIIVSLVSVNVLKIFDNSGEKGYTMVEKLMEEAAGVYVGIKNPVELDTYGEIYCVTLQNLYDQGLISLPVVDPRDNFEYDNSTCIYVQNIGEKQFLYSFNKLMPPIE